MDLVVRHCGLKELPKLSEEERLTMPKHPVPLKIRGLRWRRPSDEE